MRRTLHRCGWAFALALVFATLPAAPRPARAAGDAAAAQAHYERGLAHYRAERWEDAAAAFEAAYRSDPAPVFLYNGARCLERLERLPEAIAGYEDFLAAQPAAPNRAEVELTIAQLLRRAHATRTRVRFESEPAGAAALLDGVRIGVTPLVHWMKHGVHRARLELVGHEPEERPFEAGAWGPAKLTFRLKARATGRLGLSGLPAGARVEVDGGVVDVARLPLELTPGEHRLRVVCEGYQPWERTFVIAAGRDETIVSAMVPELPAEEDRPVVVDGGFDYPWPAWLTTGLTAAGLGVGIAFWLQGEQGVDEVSDYAAQPGSTSAGWQDRVGAAERDLTIGAVGFGVAGAAAVSTVIVLVVYNVTGDEPAATVTPMASGPGATVMARF